MRIGQWGRALGGMVLVLAVVAGTACDRTSEKKLSAEDDFLRDMIHHHEGAIEWAKLVLERGEHEELKEMARATLKGAAEDIVAMERILGSEKLATKGHSHGGDHFGPAGIIAMRKGEVNDKVLLDWMIDHHKVGAHEGHATTPKALNPEAKELIESMNTRLDKGTEKMQTWRTQWYGV